ncbi:hypothetical protein JHK82_038189 [Glycine max]|nr:hypothetical protein JHK82_038189 [Glycine max]
MGIKSHYILTSSVRKSWQGDPCAPSKYSWNGLNRSNNGYNSPTIIALNLASSGLGGTIIASFLELKFLESLDLSNNILTGPLPDFSQLQHLKALNLSGNRLSDEIPSLLTERSNNGSLSLRKSVSMPALKQAVRSNEEIVLKTNNTQYTYSQILTITDNFDKMIGKGGCGIVYLGSLQDGTQAQLLMRVHHKNLASFLGYCNEVGHTGIIYEYMAYGNLEEYLSDARREPLSWRQRIQIAVDAAQGIEYLHHGCKPPIIHRDIKTANILLNEKMQAKVADFGFSKLFSAENESHVSTVVIGTFGYVDPEYYTSSRLTEKIDPAIIKGHQNTHIAQWVDNFLVRGDIQQIVDPRLRGDFDFGSMWKALEAAIACVPSISIQRPSMSYIVSELKESLEMEAAREKEGINSIEMNVVDLEALSGPDAR